MNEWTVVIKGDWYLPHFVNMLKQYKGNGEQTSCATEVIEQIEAQMVSIDGDGTWKTTAPVVVIDPEDREQVALILSHYHDWKWTDDMASASISDMQAALREFANPTPPKPDEPTGLGAVVEDDAGTRWVRTDMCRGAGANSWSSDDGSQDYAAIEAVRVLSEGVQS